MHNEIKEMFEECWKENEEDFKLIDKEKAYMVWLHCVIKTSEFIRQQVVSK